MLNRARRARSFWVSPAARRYCRRLWPNSSGFTRPYLCRLVRVALLVKTSIRAERYEGQLVACPILQHPTGLVDLGLIKQEARVTRPGPLLIGVSRDLLAGGPDQLLLVALLQALEIFGHGLFLLERRLEGIGHLGLTQLLGQ
jgi:hypothetical protein